MGTRLSGDWEVRWTIQVHCSSCLGAALEHGHLSALDAYEVDEANVCINEIDAAPVVWVDSFPSDVTKTKLMAAFKSLGALLFCMRQYNVAHMTFSLCGDRSPSTDDFQMEY